MNFSHTPELWAEFPALVPVALATDGIRADVDVRAACADYESLARERLAKSQEGEWPQIQAWRRAFSKMGLKPTQYRCAAESLLRRFRKEGSLPALHPLVDLCNALSLAHGVPIAVFDLDQVSGSLEVRHAAGNERYLEFSGAVEQPEPGEVVFVDEAGNAHARRWCHRQSGLSAIRPQTRRVLIVAEALEADAQVAQTQLGETLSRHLAEFWGQAARPVMLRPDARVFVA